MSKQYNKAEKQKRRTSYLKRKKTRAKTKGQVPANAATPVKTQPEAAAP
jgi:hypothetical protein